MASLVKTIDNGGEELLDYDGTVVSITEAILEALDVVDDLLEGTGEAVATRSRIGCDLIVELVGDVNAGLI